MLGYDCTLYKKVVPICSTCSLHMNNSSCGSYVLNRFLIEHMVHYRKLKLRFSMVKDVRYEWLIFLLRSQT